jgi:ubiquinone/menaquinone biosynthesis C-methylase UbiE/uncharacterized protein YbaR (Trm112 family)
MTKNKLESLLPLLACPSSGSGLIFAKDYLYSETSGIRYKIEAGIPIMLKSEIGTIDDSTQKFDYITHYTEDAAQFDYFETKYGGTEHDERRVREAIISHIPVKQDWVLDVGCGSGWVASHFSKKDKNVVSLDISLTNVQKTLDLFPFPSHFGVVGDAYSLPFRDSSFDCIICSEVIEHSQYPKQIVSDLIRCLKAGGRLIMTTPYKEVLKYSLCIHCNKPTPHNAHLHSFDEISLKKLFDDHDKINLKFEKFGNRASLHLRTHIILRYLNYGLWRIIDKFCNLIINTPARILLKIDKRRDV